MKPWRWTGGTAAAWAVALLGACASDGRPALDLGGLRLDGGFPFSPVDAGLEAGLGPVRGNEPALPSADLRFELPFGGPAVETPREIAARAGRLDVALSIDTTGSFDEEIAQLRADLQRRVIPEVRGRVDDAAFAVTAFQDFPVAPRGDVGDLPFVLAGAMSTDSAAIFRAVAALSLGNGGDAPESGFEALYQIATGAGLPNFIAPFRGAGAGGVGFREGSLRAVIHATDSTSHGPDAYERLGVRGTRGFADVVAAMTDVEARVLGVASEVSARPELEALAVQTGAVVPAAPEGCATGLGGSFRAPLGAVCPLVFDIASDGTGLSDAVVDAVAGLVDSVRFGEVYGLVRDDRLGFVQAVEAREARLAMGTTPPELRDLRPLDGIDDTFVDAPFGAELVFAIVLRNDRVRPEDYDQRFRFQVDIVGDGQVLDSVTLAVTVPGERAAPPDAGPDTPPDAGMSDAGMSDAGMSDAGMSDAGMSDAGMDAGMSDAGP